VRYAGLFAFLCAGAQAWAYTRSYLAAEQPIHCMAVPFGECESIIASGYAGMLGGPVGGYDASSALATGVPLLMWLAVVVSAHNPQMKMQREGKSRLSPAAYLYGALLVAVLAYGAMQLRPYAMAEPVPTSTQPTGAPPKAAQPHQAQPNQAQPDQAGAPADSAR